MNEKNPPHRAARGLEGFAGNILRQLFFLSLVYTGVYSLAKDSVRKASSLSVLLQYMYVYILS